MNKPIALDICCRKGGATVGLQRAGFYVIAVDIEPQPGNPADEFMLMDGLRVLESLTLTGQLAMGDRWVTPDLIWQGWPCQHANTQTHGNVARGIPNRHQQFIPRARELSDRIGIPYVLEQPASSVKGTIRKDVTLCMDMFKGEMPPPWVQKHRSFEISGFTVPQPEHPRGPVARHDGYVRGWRGRHGNVPGFYRDGPYVAAHGDGGGKATVDEMRHAYKIDWMTDHFDLREAIPPDFSEYIGRAFLAGKPLPG